MERKLVAENLNGITVKFSPLKGRTDGVQLEGLRKEFQAIGHSIKNYVIMEFLVEGKVVRVVKCDHANLWQNRNTLDLVEIVGKTGTLIAVEYGHPPLRKEIPAKTIPLKDLFQV